MSLAKNITSRGNLGKKRLHIAAQNGVAKDTLLLFFLKKCRRHQKRDCSGTGLPPHWWSHRRGHPGPLPCGGRAVGVAPCTWWGGVASSPVSLCSWVSERRVGASTATKVSTPRLSVGAPTVTPYGPSGTVHCGNVFKGDISRLASLLIRWPLQGVIRYLAFFGPGVFAESSCHLQRPAAGRPVPLTAPCEVACPVPVLRCLRLGWQCGCRSGGRGAGELWEELLLMEWSRSGSQSVSRRPSAPCLPGTREGRQAELAGAGPPRTAGAAAPQPGVVPRV